MDIHDIRQDRLRLYIATRCGKRGKQKYFAGLIGKQPDYVSRMLTRGPNRKNIGEELAREMERMLGLPKLWFDVLPGGPDGPQTGGEVREMSLSDTGFHIGLTADRLPPTVQRQILELLQTMVAEHAADPNDGTSAAHKQPPPPKTQ